MQVLLKKVLIEEPLAKQTMQTSQNFIALMPRKNDVPEEVEQILSTMTKYV